MTRERRQVVTPHSSLPAFRGFPKDTVRFLRALARNNDEAWLEANRARYEAGIHEGGGRRGRMLSTWTKERHESRPAASRYQR